MVDAIPVEELACVSIRTQPRIWTNLTGNEADDSPVLSYGYTHRISRVSLAQP